VEQCFRDTDPAPVDFLRSLTSSKNLQNCTGACMVGTFKKNPRIFLSEAETRAAWQVRGSN
jgi:hypothetical protein